MHSNPVLDEAEAILDEAIKHAPELATKDDVKRGERKSDRNRTIILCGVALIAILAFIGAGYAIERSNVNSAQTAVNTSALKTYDQAIAELRAQGVPEEQLPPPPVTPTDTQEIDVDGLVTAASAKVLAQIRNDPNFTGQRGPEGAPCDPLVNPSCQGPAGANGTNGIDGENGVNGRDSTVPGPAGEPPSGWETAFPNGTSKCDRAVPFDPNAPRYNCVYTPNPPPPEEPN